MQMLATDRFQGADMPALHPFPDGWYVIELGSNLRKEQLIEKTWMGTEIIVWRDAAGTVCLADAFCPHLGAHLGPSSGGMVRDGKLVCPFHGFRYDASGKCVATREAPPPRSAQLKTYEVDEANGFIFAYWDNAGRRPEWRIPDLSTDGWTNRAAKPLRLRAHPQTTSENSVDFSHLAHVHGYRGLQQDEPTTVEGPVLSSSYSFTRSMLTGGLRSIDLSVSIKIEVWGLGVSLVQTQGQSTNLEIRQWIMATPVDGEYIDYWLVVDLRSTSDWFGLLPRAIRNKVLPKLLLNELVLEVRKDAEIWSRQRYQPRPVLCQSDRDIFRFRRYCEQFYGAGC